MPVKSAIPLHALGLTLLLFSAMTLPGAGEARVEALSFESAQHEQRYKALVAELRCLVCQNQNLADSNAELAVDLRQKVYEMIAAGNSDDEIVDFMVQRYGDFVLYRPPFQVKTIALWVGPFILLIVGAAAFYRISQSRRDSSQSPIPDGDVERARSLLSDDEDR